MNEKTLLRRIKSNIHKKGLSVYARELGITKQYLSDVNQERRGIGPNLAEAMGYELSVYTVRTYQKMNGSL